MSKVLLQVNFDLDPSRNEDLELTLTRAEKLARTPGLIWKVWLRDEERRRGGGVYLFEDAASAHAWADGRFETMAQRMPWSSNIKVEITPVQEALSSVTRGIPAGHTAQNLQAA